MLVPWFETPLFAELEAFRREVDARLSAPLTFDVPRGVSAGHGLHFREDGDRYVVNADLPGLSLEDLEVHISGRQLSVSGQRTITTPEGFELKHRERTSWKFERALALPEDVDADNVAASLRDGVLEVSLPRVAQVESRRIEVTA